MQNKSVFDPGQVCSMNRSHITLKAFLTHLLCHYTTCMCGNCCLRADLASCDIVCEVQFEKSVCIKCVNVKDVGTYQ
uniref:Uncharacterized protein n=1 Tax=Anguilla anguilla TaxID=7936 RepID=A0A0E9XL55_ANGAN